MSKKILVTGGTGFIGSGIVRHLLKKGHAVRVFDDNSRGNMRRLADVANDIDFLEGDIRNSDAVASACEGMESIIHLAYVNGTEFFYTKPDLVLEVGVKGMVNVLDAAIRHGIRDFFLASSSEVYQKPPKIPTDESAPLIVPDPLNPRYSYGGGKIIAELMAVNYGRKHFDRTVIFRPHNVYGPDMGWEHVIPQFAVRMKEFCDTHPQGDFEFPIKGDGTATRSFIFINDFVDAIGLIFQKASGLELIHVGTMDELSIEAVAHQVAKCYNVQPKLSYTEAPSGETSRRCPDIFKLRQLGFAPKVSFANGVEETVQWYKNNFHLARSK